MTENEAIEMRRKRMTRKVCAEMDDMQKKSNREVRETWRPKELERKNYSSECSMDDDHDERCWSCTCFVFPIGCMKGEEENKHAHIV